MLEKPKKRKKTPYKTLVRKLDKLFSQFVRERDSIKGVGACVTCGRTVDIKQADCGHFASRGYFPTRWDSKNAHLQCKTCNAFKGGCQWEMGNYIDNKYGEGTAEKLLEKAKSGERMDRGKVETLIEHYKMLLNE